MISGAAVYVKPGETDTQGRSPRLGLAWSFKGHGALVNLPSLRMQRGGSDDQRPSGLQVSRLAPSTRKPESQLYCSTVPTGKEPRLLSLRLVEPCCTMTGLTHTSGRERGRELHTTRSRQNRLGGIKDV